MSSGERLCPPLGRLDTVGGGNRFRSPWEVMTPFTGLPILDDTSAVFVFPAVAAGWWAVSRELLDAEGAFATAARWVDEIFMGIAGSSLLSELRSAGDTVLASSTVHARPMTLMLQLALCTELAAAGCVPDAALGRGVGAASAAYIGGALTLHDAVLVSLHRDSGALAQLPARVPRVPLYSSGTGAAVTGAGSAADHWCEDGRPDRFADALGGLIAAGRRVFVEICPHPHLGADVRACLERAGTVGAVIPTLGRVADLSAIASEVEV